jgi:SAM-dependent methyltransferase
MGLLRSKKVKKLIELFNGTTQSGIDDATPLHGYDTGRQSIPQIDRLPDAELQMLNAVLPWAAFVVDQHGRRFGRPYSANKRAEPQIIPDPRIIELDRRFPLRDLHVLELGCFEGIHTCALAALAKKVTAVDARIENVVKTIVRCAMFGYKPDTFYLDLEQELPADMDLSCDILHHVGVLYHLTDPVAHLSQMSPKVTTALMLDTHVAPEDAELKQYERDGTRFSYMEYREMGRAAPFAGMRDHAKWLREQDLLKALEMGGFTRIEVAQRRQERNGPRVLSFAAK